MIDTAIPYEKDLQQLLSKHLAIQDEPLQLALWFQPDRDKEAVFVFEVADNFGNNDVDPEKEFLEISFPPSSDLPFGGHDIHLILTNPEELKIAHQERWKSLQEILQSIQQNRYRILHKSEQGEDLWSLIRG